MGKRDVTILAGIVAALLLLLSWQSYAVSRSLQQEMVNLRSELSNLRHHMSQDVSRVAATVHQIREDARWWSFAGTRLEEITPETAFYRVDWQIKDFQEGSPVVLNYRRADEKDFSEILAEEGTNGFFSALLPVKMPPEGPRWQLYVSRSRGGGPGENREEYIVDEWGSYPREPENYHYFFTVAQDGTLRSSDIQHLHVGELWGRFFHPLYTHVNIMEDGDIHVFMNQETGYPSDVQYQLEKARLEVRRGGRLVQSYDFRGNIQLGAVDTTVEPLEAGQSLFIVLDYSQGKTVEKEISLDGGY